MTQFTLKVVLLRTVYLMVMLLVQFYHAPFALGAPRVSSTKTCYIAKTITAESQSTITAFNNRVELLISPFVDNYPWIIRHGNVLRLKRFLSNPGIAVARASDLNNFGSSVGLVRQKLGDLFTEQAYI